MTENLEDVSLVMSASTKGSATSPTCIRRALVGRIRGYSVTVLAVRLLTFNLGDERELLVAMDDIDAIWDKTDGAEFEGRV